MYVGFCLEEHEAQLTAEGLRLLILSDDLRGDFKIAIGELDPGDTLLIHSVRPLVRSTLDLVRLIVSVTDKGAELQSLVEPWLNTTGTGAEVIAGLARFERDLLKERTAAGREKAIENGITMGRPPKLSNGQRVAALEMYAAGVPQIDIARAFNLSPATVSTMVRENVDLAEENNDAA